ncbi:hypothetical protein [Paraburkholderia kururiensis]|uniref:Uncharacterized protein n=1 Tax=Paraburkholderia kururiensis TaxID=984307 RepID=A0ABZ0WNE6_9BURK|nr:hypothetical protein [Paraburkholderia kururiensis]WQD78892.1 hypothetical protein U0042_04055 [Paraburkholderia kururiensis]
MLPPRNRTVTALFDNVEMCAEYSEETGRLRILRDGALLHEWFPPNSWFAIASVAGARNWGTQPDESELRALLDSEMSTLRAD